MRKIILSAFSLFFVLILNAQVINKGDHLFGGSFSFSVYDLNNNGPVYSTAGNLGILPSLAWAIKNDLTIGLRGTIGYNYSGNKTTSTDKIVNNNFDLGTGVFLRKYKLLKNRFGLHFNNEASVIYFVNKTKQIGSTSTSLTSHSWGGMYSFQPGVFYKFSENFFGEGNIGGVYASYYSDGSTKNFGIGASFLQSFNLGINYRIEKRAKAKS
jgi:hypothetical protein